MAQFDTVTTPSQPVWRIQEQSESVCQKLGEAVSVDSVIAHVLINRGVRSVQDAQQVLDIHNLPVAYFPDAWVQTAVNVLQELPAGANILVYGDYDVDGITSTSVMIAVYRPWALSHSFIFPIALMMDTA